MAEPTPGRERGESIALALGAGGARGLAQIGVIEALEARGLRVASVAGSSSGALVGGVYAAGKLREFREGFEKLTRGEFLRLLDPVVGRPGVIGGERLVDAMREVVGDPRIEELPLPFTAAAVDMERQRVVWLRNGPLWLALRASFAIPGLFTPQRVHGRELVDGGLLAPMPITATRLSDAHRLVAVDMHGRPARPPGEPADGVRAEPVRGSRLGRWLDRRLGNPPGEASLSTPCRARWTPCRRRSPACSWRWTRRNWSSTSRATCARCMNSGARRRRSRSGARQPRRRWTRPATELRVRE